MELLLSLAARVDRANRAVGRLVSWLALSMVLVGAWNAIGRYTERWTGLRLSSNALTELQWYLFSLVFLLGAPFALRLGAHVRVDVLYGRLGPRRRAWIDLVGALLLLVPFCVFAVWVSLPAVLESIRVREGSPDPGGLPRWPLKLVVPLAFGLLALQGFSEAVKRLALLRGVPPERLDLDEQPGGGALSHETESGR